MAIDEKKLIEELRMEYECADDLSDFTCGVKRGLSEALTIVKYQPKVGEWIPAEERLPKHYGQYLITAINDCGGVYMDVSYYDSQYKSFSPDGVEDDIAIAWMDLPKPYEVRE